MVKKTLVSLLAAATLSLGGCATTKTPQPIIQPVVKKVQVVREVVQRKRVQVVNGDGKYDYSAALLDAHPQGLSSLEKHAYRLLGIHSYRVLGSNIEIHRRYRGTATAFSSKGSEEFLLTNRHLLEAPSAQKVRRDPYSLYKIIRKFRAAKKKVIFPIRLAYVRSSYTLERKGEKARVPIILAKNNSLDVALLQATKKKSANTIPYATWGNSKELRVGHVVYISGYGGGRHLTTRGIYSGEHKAHLKWLQGRSQLIDAKVISGHSGSAVHALRDGRNELVGILWAHLGGKYGQLISSEKVMTWLTAKGFGHLIPKK